ncbi:MAG TPA: hypothetical protein VFV52_03765 [Bacilli bacterium]|nr:hypothetical protein [Bacilli bacterium]
MGEYLPMNWPKGDANQNKQLEYVQSMNNTILPEEFPEGPYGASVFNDQPLGKSTPWEPGQHVASRFQDENPAFTDTTAVPQDADLPDL